MRALIPPHLYWVLEPPHACLRLFSHHSGAYLYILIPTSLFTFLPLQGTTYHTSLDGCTSHTLVPPSAYYTHTLPNIFPLGLHHPTRFCTHLYLLHHLTLPSSLSAICIHYRNWVGHLSHILFPHYLPALHGADTLYHTCSGPSHTVLWVNLPLGRLCLHVVDISGKQDTTLSFSLSFALGVYLCVGVVCTATLSPSLHFPPTISFPLTPASFLLLFCTLTPHLLPTPLWM